MNRTYIKWSIRITVIVFAAIGFGLTAAFFAVKWHITDDPGNVDINDRYYAEMASKYNDTGFVDYSLPPNEAALYYKIAILHQYAPLNAELILNAYNKSKNIVITNRMFDAVNIYLQNNTEYNRKIGEIWKMNKDRGESIDSNIFAWMRMSEWADFKVVMKKEFELINRVGKETGIEPRLIAAMVTGEQIRLFDAEREAYKKWIGPLKILSVETKFSWGVTGIKPETAMKIENFLKSDTSCFFPGEKYRHMLDFKTKNIEQERFDRITDWHNHYYSYLYAALNLRMIYSQWKKAGYDISNRPEILATIFNLGFEISKPKPAPRVGGSNIKIKGKNYTFGALAYEFYYSGELIDEFPFWEKRFVD